MKFKYYPAEKLRKEILDIIGKYLDLKLYKVFFFGSRVTKKNVERSDVDIGIEGPNPVSLSILEKIEGDLENLPTLYKFEIVDFKKVAPNFKKVALKKIEEINVKAR